MHVWCSEQVFSKRLTDGNRPPRAGSAAKWVESNPLAPWFLQFLDWSLPGPEHCLYQVRGSCHDEKTNMSYWENTELAVLYCKWDHCGLTKEKKICKTWWQLGCRLLLQSLNSYFNSLVKLRLFLQALQSAVDTTWKLYSLYKQNSQWVGRLPALVLGAYEANSLVSFLDSLKAWIFALLPRNCQILSFLVERYFPVCITYFFLLILNDLPSKKPHPFNFTGSRSASH